MKRYEICVVKVTLGSLVFQFGDQSVWDWVEAKLASSKYSEQRKYKIVNVHAYCREVKELDVHECAWWLTSVLCDDGWEPFDGGVAGGAARGVFHFSLRRKRVD